MVHLVARFDRHNYHLIEIKFVMSSPSTDRFPAWLALSIFSAVCLAATETERSAAGGGDRSSADKWVLSVEILSMSFAFFACLAYLFESLRERFVAKIPEISFVRKAVPHISTTGHSSQLTRFTNAIMHCSLCLF